MAGIIDGLADLITNVRRSLNISHYNVIRKGEKLVEAGLLNNNLLKQIASNEKKISGLNKEIQTYHRGVKKSLTTQRKSRRKIADARNEMKSLRKDFSKNHPFWGKWFLLTSIPAAIPLIGDVVKRGLCRVVSPEYREYLDQIENENEIITAAIEEEKDLLDQIDVAKANIEELKEKNTSIYDDINKSYEENKHRIPVILYIQDNISTFQQAHEQGIISDRFIDAISYYLIRMKTGQELPENINESEFLDVLKDYKAVIDSFKRNGDVTMVKDPEFLRDTDENIVVEVEPKQDKEQNQEEQGEQEGTTNTQKQRDKFKSNNDCKIYTDYKINAAAFEEMISKSPVANKLRFDGKQILTLIGAMIRATSEKDKVYSKEETKLIINDLINKIKTNDDFISGNMQYFMEMGAATFRDALENISPKEHKDLRSNIIGREFIEYCKLVPAYRKVLQEYEQQKQAAHSNQTTKNQKTAGSNGRAA